MNGAEGVGKRAEGVVVWAEVVGKLDEGVGEWAERMSVSIFKMIISSEK